MHHHLRLAMQTIRTSYEPKSVRIFEQLLGGVKVAQVAEDSGMTTQAIHKVKQRIRDRLKACVAAQINEEDAPDG